MEGWLAKIAAAGGNAVRLWLHIDGTHSPKFDSQGHATGEDTDSLIKELGEFLDAAQKHNIFIIMCLWNAAVKPQQMLQLYHNEAALQSYLDKVLTPMAKGLANHKALGAWEIINEPVGSILQSITDSEKCFDTHKLTNSGANWAGTGLTMKEVLLFINRHSAAIHSAAPGTLVTTGDSERSSSNVCSDCFNYYSDQCLTAAGGKANGHLDFYQFHTYTSQGKYGEFSTMKKSSSVYNLDKPLIIGEFSTDCSESKNAVTNYKHAYDGGFAGVLAWQYNEGGDCSDKQAAMDQGMASIKDMTTNGKIKITI
jgi:mannan endo-1,4-beta-mannosidase